MDAPVTLFYSYAHEDEKLRDELQGHLKILERRGLLAPWHDRQIVAGQDWAGEIDDSLRRAELVLLLVSKDFIESDYIIGTELKVAMQRHAEAASVVVPILVRAVNIEPEDADTFPFMKLQGLPVDLQPVASWPNRDEAWTNVAKGLRATVKDILARRPPAPPTLTLQAAKKRPPPPAAAVPAGTTSTDPVIERVIAETVARIDSAQRLRGEPMDEPARKLLRQAANTLIDTPEQKRVLWVDDRPGNNTMEVAALRKLQTEVVEVAGTDAAMRCIVEDTEPFDLVISDWDRPAEGKDAGLVLLERLRAEGRNLPVVYYHGAFGGAAQRLLRATRAARARHAGAAGEAVLPDELMLLVTKTLGN